MIVLGSRPCYEMEIKLPKRDPRSTMLTESGYFMKHWVLDFHYKILESHQNLN